MRILFKPDLAELLGALCWTDNLTYSTGGFAPEQIHKPTKASINQPHTMIHLPHQQLKQSLDGIVAYQGISLPSSTVWPGSHFDTKIPA